MFTAVTTKSSADIVFDQVADQIVGGDLEPGVALPGERELAAQLQVSRSVVREALQRLAQAGLVEIRQGGATRVLDFQDSADMNLLNRLLINSDGAIDPKVLRSMIEMRLSIGIDAARLCALRADQSIQTQLRTLVNELEQADELLDKQDIDLRFWETVIIGSGNIVYRLAYNGLATTYVPIRGVIASLVEPELVNIAGHRRMVSAIGKADAAGAERAARNVLESSSLSWADLIHSLESEEL